jgi:hypothetical protein
MVALSASLHSPRTLPNIHRGLTTPLAPLLQVQLVIDKLLPREGLQAKPLLAIGASSGGAFVLMLPLMYDLVAVQPQIMGLPAPYFDKHIKEFVTGGRSMGRPCSALPSRGGHVGMSVCSQQQGMYYSLVCILAGGFQR